MGTDTLSLFNFNNHDVRVVMIDGSPWWMAADACRALGLSGYPSQHLVRLASNEKRVIRRKDVSDLKSESALFGPSQPSASAISESGLYKLVNRSNKPEARAFQDWVTRGVLPAIRKDGSYVLGEEKVRTGEMTEDQLVLAAMEALLRKADRLAAERDAAKKIIHKELERVTVDEFRALNHQYWKTDVRTRVSQIAAGIAKARGIRLEKQRRELVNGPGAGRWVYPYIYPRAILAEACARLGVDAK